MQLYCCSVATGHILEEHRTSPGLLLALLGHDAMQRLRDAHTAHNLKPRQFQILGLLQERGALGQRELGQTMGVDPSVLVTLLNPLEADGLVHREARPVIPPHVDYRLTEVGEELTGLLVPLLRWIGQHAEEITAR